MHTPGDFFGSFLLTPFCELDPSPHSNDAFDASTGVDRSKPESVVNLTGNRQLVLCASLVFLAAGTALLAKLISATGDMRITTRLAMSILCGYLYQGPPFRSGGEHCCAFFQKEVTCASPYVCLRPQSWTLLQAQLRGLG